MGTRFCLKKLYRENPYIFIPIYKFHHSKERRKYLRFLDQSERWSEDQMCVWQFKKIKETVEYAYSHVEFYRNKYKAVGYENGDLKDWKDYYSLPCVSKTEIKNNPDLFLSDEYRTSGKYRVSYTSGSTDKPLKFYMPFEAQFKEEAFFEYYWAKYGYRFGERAVVFRGHQTIDSEKETFYKYDRMQNFKLFDSRYVSDERYLWKYDKQIKSFKADTLFAYPSSAYMLAKAYEKSGITPPRFKKIFLGSENTYEDQLRYIEEMFKGESAYHYGHSEGVLLAIKYRDNHFLGFLPQYGHIDEYDETGKRYGDNELGQIIGTGFSKTMPFIRYKTEDYAIFSGYKSKDFMKNCTSVERIEGRKHEFVVTKDKRRVSLCSIAGAHMSEMTLISDMQYEQKEIGKLIVKVTLLPDTDAAKAKKAISEKLEAFFENTVEVQTVIVPEIKYSSNGKKIMLKQALPL